MKKKVLVLALLAILSAICASGTFAYFIADYNTHNIITSGGVGVEIILKELDTNGNEIDVESTKINNVMPGMPESRILRIKNPESNPVWVRVKVSYTITGESGQELPNTFNDELLVYNDINSKWVLKDDGYYYYTEPVEGNKQSEALFNEVKFHGDMSNDYSKCKVEMNIYAQGVQSQNNGDTVFEASGW